MRKRRIRLALAFVLAATCTAASLSSAAGAEAAGRTVILLKDGSWVDCDAVLPTERGYRVQVAGKTRDLPLAAIDAISGLMLRALDFERRGVRVRERYDLAQSFLAAGAPALGRKQLEAVAREKPILRPVTEVWLKGFPLTRTAKALGEGLEAFTSAAPLEAYQALNAVTSDRDSSPAHLMIATRFLHAIVRMLEEKNQLDPGAGGGDDPVKKGKLSRIRSLILEGDQLLTDAFKWRDAGDPGRTGRCLENAALALDSALKEGESFGAEGPGAPYAEQIERLVAWARRVLFDVKITAAEYHLGRKDTASAEKAVDEALALDPDNSRARELKSRLQGPGRKRG